MLNQKVPFTFLYIPSYDSSARALKFFPICRCTFYLYSRRSPGWHWSALQIASKVDSRTAFALPFFKMEMLAIVMPTLSASSVTLIFRFANMTSMLMIIAMLALVTP
jgi:hypothetical protein